MQLKTSPPLEPVTSTPTSDQSLWSSANLFNLNGSLPHMLTSEQHELLAQIAALVSERERERERERSFRLRLCP